MPQRSGDGRMGNRTLIVGGAGYVGGFLSTSLYEYGHDIAVYDSLVYENHFLKEVPFIRGDVRDREKLSKILPDFDTVIWLAAIVGDGACAIDPFLTQAINEDSVKWLVDNYHKRIVFASTCSIYGINNELIYENAEPNPISVYAKTKLAAEKYIRENSKNHLIFRLGTLFGIGDTHSRLRLDLVVNVLAKRAACGEDLRVFGGDQWRPLLHVRDVTTAILCGQAHNITGLYNLSLKNCRIREIADEICKEIPGTKVAYEDLNFEDQRNYRVVSDAYESKGWSPSYSLKEGIQQIYRCVKENRLKYPDSVLYSNEFYLGAKYQPF